jgi:hypothetical protein
MDNETLGHFLNGDTTMPHYKHHDQLFCYAVVEDSEHNAAVCMWRCAKIPDIKNDPLYSRQQVFHVGQQLTLYEEGMKVRYYIALLELNPAKTAALSTEVRYLDIDLPHDYYIVSDMLKQIKIGRPLNTVTGVKAPPDNVTYIKRREQ